MNLRSFIIVAAVVCCAFMAQSCGSMMQTSKYVVNLSAVESPENAKVQFGETKVVTFTEGDVQKYRYEDDYINIVWFVGYKQFDFSLTNKTDHTIKINWDDISYVDMNSNVGRMMHSGVKYTDRNNSQPATSIPRKASVTDILLPTDNVYWASGQYGGWRETPLIPYTYSNGGAEGKTMTILMPIMIENVQNDYTFEFLISPKPEATQGN